MIAELSKEEKESLNKAISNPKDYVVEVDNDFIYVTNIKTGEYDTLAIYGQDLVVALLRYMGANAQFI